MARFLKLERMEIHGFKSFYGRTRFEFPEGITAVVGPNGCGKSNIGDAISWVLGEQRASSLRSESMEDVIFNGSQGKKPLGMAEVSLHFRNVRARLGDAACGTLDGDTAVSPDVMMDPLGDATKAIAEQGHGNGHGNGHHGHGNGQGNGHGDAAVVEAEAGASEAVPVVAEALAPAGAGAEGAATVAAPAEAAAEGTTTQPARFFLEDLPDEVVVTRRLYRSGESEYALNGQRCRLRDVQDLLARTEIGTRLYTTIEQGKIDQILLAKPKERRVLIEEAAGILGYKIKRRHTEQKLEATQANLLRLADIAVEVDKQIQSLRRQAAKARRYRRLMEALRERRASLAWRRLLDCDAGLEASARALSELGEREAASAGELARAESDLEALRLKLDAAEEEARQRRDALHALDMELDRIQERQRAGSEQAADLERRASEAEEEIGALHARASERDAAGQAVTVELGLEAERVRAAEGALQALEEDRIAQAAGIARAEADLEGMRQRLLERLDRLAESGRRRAALEEQGRSALQALERLARERGDAEKTALDLDAGLRLLAEETLGRQARVEESGRVHHEEAAGLRHAEEGLAEAELRLEERRGRFAALSDRLEALADLERRHAGMAEGVVDLLRGGDGFEARGVVGESLDVPAGLERAVAAALGRLQDGLIVPAMHEAARGARLLRQRGTGRAAFVPAGSARDLLAPGPPEAFEGILGVLSERVAGLERGGVIESRLSRVLLAADLEAAVAAAPSLPGWSFVTRDGDLLDADGALYGGDGPELQHGVLARRAERTALARQIEEIDAERGAAERDCETLRREAGERRARVAAAGAQLEDEQRGHFQSDLARQQKEAERGRILATLPLLEHEAGRLEREAATRAQEAFQAKGEQQEHEAQRVAEEEGIRVASEGIASLRGALDAAQGKASEARAMVAAGHQRLAALARERESVAEAERELRARLAERDAQRLAARARLQEIARLSAEFAEQRERITATRVEAAAQDEAALAGLAYDRSLHHAREQAAKEARALLETTRGERQEQEIRRARLGSDLEHLEASCREDLGRTLDELRAAPPILEEGRTLAEDEREVAEGRASIDAIGPVNLMAIEQCTELEERHSGMEKERQDLEAAIESLRDTIRRINRESRQRFLSAFEAIKAGFETSFTVLFGGGRAELRLQEGEEDILEAGVEIAAQPPGKRLQSLALLSGGEKALTAVALLFSLFRYRPSPFCVLDEVDAPLDEANVERFTKLLRELTDDTQFIMITHNRKSMEAANLLYGVTMEEPGVSKVLPLRFE
ncbi:MAG TPA: chromosome segregation protein SMC [Candidatus Polarisedimenticolia bacterium]|nr:chromosome segregation protein SMC [Candidatus Polarisedimenticolia bacterium]